MMSGGENIMVILSSPSGVGKTTLQKNYNKNINHLKYLSPIPLDRQGLMKLMALTIIS